MHLDMGMHIWIVPPSIAGRASYLWSPFAGASLWNGACARPNARRRRLLCPRCRRSAAWPQVLEWHGHFCSPWCGSPKVSGHSGAGRRMGRARLREGRVLERSAQRPAARETQAHSEMRHSVRVCADRARSLIQFRAKKPRSWATLLPRPRSLTYLVGLLCAGFLCRRMAPKPRADPSTTHRPSRRSLFAGPLCLLAPSHPLSPSPCPDPFQPLRRVSRPPGHDPAIALSQRPPRQEGPTL